MSERTGTGSCSVSCKDGHDLGDKAALKGACGTDFVSIPIPSLLELLTSHHWLEHTNDSE